MEYQKYYLKEFQYFDGADEIIMNIVDINFDKMTIHIAETYQGKITVKEYDLKRDNKFNLYFEYGLFRNKIEITFNTPLKKSPDNDQGSFYATTLENTMT